MQEKVLEIFFNITSNLKFTQRIIIVAETMINVEFLFTSLKSPKL